MYKGKKHNEYQLNWMNARREKILQKMGPCYFCGSDEALQIHHINKEDKESHRIWSWSEKRIKEELLKCIAICEECHKKFHALDHKKPLVHGTLNAYNQYGCRCEECRAANCERVARQR